MKLVQRLSVLANILLLLVCVLLVLQPAGGRGQAAHVPISAKPLEGPAILDDAALDSNNPTKILAAQAPFVTPPQAEKAYPVPPSAEEDPAPDSNNPIEIFAREAPFVTRPRAERAYPLPPPAEVVALLKSKKAAGQTDHFAFLLEYGLRVHQKYLEHTSLSRVLPLKENLMLAELVRLTQLPEYTNAHEAGWLDYQFDNRFSGTGYSSYQIYVWSKEHYRDIVNDEQQYPNSNRILETLDAIDKSACNGVGGGMVCHYGCV
jgi:hypothetical protein